MQTVVSDTSPIIILAKTNRLNLLRNVFEQVIIPREVYSEIVKKEDIVSQLLNNVDYFRVLSVDYDETMLNLLSILDKGEAEAIYLAKKFEIPIIIDEKKGRNIAFNYNLKVIGFLGVLFLNYKKGFIGKDDITQIIEQADASGYRLSIKLKEEFLRTL